MGMDLTPIKDKTKQLRYNCAGWVQLIKLLNKWGANTSEFSGSEDGSVISEATCIAVANAIESHLPELSNNHQEWLQPHIDLWRNCGGYKQW